LRRCNSPRPLWVLQEKLMRQKSTQSVKVVGTQIKEVYNV
jgi:hypothetical protein